MLALSRRARDPAHSKCVFGDAERVCGGRLACKRYRNTTLPINKSTVTSAQRGSPKRDAEARPTSARIASSVAASGSVARHSCSEETVATPFGARARRQEFQRRQTACTINATKVSRLR
ncbi:hypothetical protein LSAT2_017534, partial [Lamellibrachia satsuma]